MAQLSATKISGYFQRADMAKTQKERGNALEDLICYVFERHPGIEIAARNVLGPYATEELDIVFWNDVAPKGFSFLPNPFIVECKNWSTPVDGVVISYFRDILKHTGCTAGILVAANGITGSPTPPMGAHSHVAMALADGQRILIVTREELMNLGNTSDLLELLKKKILELTVRRTQLV